MGFIDSATNCITDIKFLRKIWGRIITNPLCVLFVQRFFRLSHRNGIEKCLWDSSRWISHPATSNRQMKYPQRRLNVANGELQMTTLFVSFSNWKCDFVVEIFLQGFGHSSVFRILQVELTKSHLNYIGQIHQPQKRRSSCWSNNSNEIELYWLCGHLLSHRWYSDYKLPSSGPMRHPIERTF